jgi:hypothetical protein
MIKDIIQILNYSDYYGVSERIDFAKGKYQTPTSWNKIKNTLKRYIQWRRK